MASWDNWISNITTTVPTSNPTLPITGYGTTHENVTTYCVARHCAVCSRMDGTMEISPGGVIQKAGFWICPDCCRKIGEVIRNIV